MSILWIVLKFFEKIKPKYCVYNNADNYASAFFLHDYACGVFSTNILKLGWL